MPLKRLGVPNDALPGVGFMPDIESYLDWFSLPQDECLRMTDVTHRVSLSGELVDGLRPYAGVFGLGLLFLTRLDFFLDVISAQPIIGDGFAQTVGAIAGILAIRQDTEETLFDEADFRGSVLLKGTRAALGKVRDFLAAYQDKLIPLESRSASVGLVAFISGLAHLAFGWLPVI